MYENKSSFDLYISLVALVFKHSLFYFSPKKILYKKTQNIGQTEFETIRQPGQGIRNGLRKSSIRYIIGH